MPETEPTQASVLPWPTSEMFSLSRKALDSSTVANLTSV